CKAESCPGNFLLIGARSLCWAALLVRLSFFIRCGHLLSRPLKALKNGRRAGIPHLSPFSFCWEWLSGILCSFPLRFSFLPSFRFLQPSTMILTSTNTSAL